MIPIYKIPNRLNWKIYVGQTKQPIEKRFLQHSKADSPLGQAMQDCGLENFTIEVIEECETPEQANERERFWIRVLKSKMPNGYNRTNGGEGHEAKVGTAINNLSTNTLKLGEIIREYRQRNKISMSDFAKSSGLSKPYISMLEADKNSNGGKPIKPSVETVLKVSYAVGMPLDELLRKLGDEEMDLRHPEFSAEETKFVDSYRGLNDEGKRLVFGMIRQLNFGHALPTNQHAAAV